MKLIVYTQRVDLVEHYQERRDCTDQRIAKLIQACGYYPIPLSNVVEALTDLIKQLKPAGILLTGGNSLFHYGGNAPERDRTDETLIQIACQQNIPLYGICRGMQSILQYFDVPLFQSPNHIAVHHKIHGLIKRDEVNSYHSMAAKSLKKELQELSRSDDDFIEAIRHKAYPILGTMWHPERENPFQKKDIDIIQKLMAQKF